MSTRLSRLLVEARLYLHLLGGTLVLHLWLPVMAVICIPCLLLAGVMGFAYADVIAAVVLLLLLSAPLWLTRPVHASALPPSTEEDGESLDLYPALKELARQTAADLGKSPPSRVLFRLSPIFRHWGAPEDPDDRELGSRTLRVDLSRAGVCSVFEFRCDLAKAILQPRMSGWLAHRVLAQIDLLAERLNAGTSGIAAFQRYLWVSLLREHELSALRTWRLFAEMETDRALAALFGKRCVASWIEKSWFAEWVFPVYQQIWLEPAWQRGYLPPTMEGFRRLHEEAGAEWLIDTDADRPVNLESKYELGEIARWQPHRMRLLALNAAEESTATVWDARPAALLLDDGDAEEKVIRRAMAIGTEPCNDDPLERISWREYPDAVILAEVDDMLHEGAELFQGRTLMDLPKIVEEAPHMVYEEVYMPFLPPQFENRLASMPNPLSGFLIKHLLERGWEMRFDLAKGVSLCHPADGRFIDPNDLVHGLADGSASAEDFVKLVGLSSASESLGNSEECAPVRSPRAIPEPEPGKSAPDAAF